MIFQSKQQACDAFGDLHGRNIYDRCCQMEIKWGLAQEHDVSMSTNCSSKSFRTEIGVPGQPAVSMVTGDSNIATSSWPECLPSTTPALSTLEDLSSDKLIMAASATEEHTQAIGIVATCVDIDDAVQPAAILDVMDHDVTDELQAFPALTMTKECVPVTVLPVAAAPAIDTDSSNTNIEVPANCSMRFPDSDISIIMPVDGPGVVGSQPDIPTLRCLPPSTSLLLQGNQGGHYISNEMLLLMQGVEQQPWPPPTLLVFYSVGVKFRPTPWPSFGCHIAVVHLDSIWFKEQMQDRNTRLSTGVVTWHQWLIQLVIPWSACALLCWIGEVTVSIHQQLALKCYTSAAKLVMFSDGYWLLFTCHHELVQWKLSWVSTSSCCFASSIKMWHNAMVDVIWSLETIKLRFCDLLYNNFQISQLVAQWICRHLPNVNPWIFSLSSMLPARRITLPVVVHWCLHILFGCMKRMIVQLTSWPQVVICMVSWLDTYDSCLFYNCRGCELIQDLPNTVGGKRELRQLPCLVGAIHISSSDSDRFTRSHIVFCILTWDPGNFFPWGQSDFHGGGNTKQLQGSYHCNFGLYLESTMNTTDDLNSLGQSEKHWQLNSSCC